MGILKNRTNSAALCRRDNLFFNNPILLQILAPTNRSHGSAQGHGVFLWAPIGFAMSRSSFFGFRNQVLPTPVPVLPSTQDFLSLEVGLW